MVGIFDPLDRCPGLPSDPLLFPATAEKGLMNGTAFIRAQSHKMSFKVDLIRFKSRWNRWQREWKAKTMILALAFLGVVDAWCAGKLPVSAQRSGQYRKAHSLCSRELESLERQPRYQLPLKNPVQTMNHFQLFPH